MRGKAEGKIVGGATWHWRSVANRARIVAKDLREARERRRHSAMNVEERQAELLGFYTRFERFVETLCDAAQYGPNARLEFAFSEDRNWVAEHYEGLRTYVGAYLPPEETDAFDRLLDAKDLSRFLADDDGTVIYRITNTREALSHYAEHLRQLAARKTA